MRDDFMDALRYNIGALMGCDIHLFSETRRAGGWVCDQTPEQEDDYFYLPKMDGGQRDYWFFGLLNQVRAEWPWSFAAQVEIPEDVSALIWEDYTQMGVDAHSAGFLTRGALKDKLAELRLLRAEALINPLADNREVLEHHAARLEEIIGYLDADVPDEDQRIVFWFDN